MASPASQELATIITITRTVTRTITTTITNHHHHYHGVNAITLDSEGVAYGVPHGTLFSAITITSTITITRTITITITITRTRTNTITRTIMITNHQARSSRMPEGVSIVFSVNMQHR